MSVSGRGQQESRVMSGAEAQRFADSHPLRLFPTFVWRVELADNVRARVNAIAPARTHPAHSHPNNFLSGAYYVKTQPGAETVNFHDPRPQTGIIRPPVTELTADNTDQVVVNVRDGTLLLFPAWLVHSVDANRSAEQRISVSFNMMFRTYTEIMSKPMW